MLFDLKAYARLKVKVLNILGEAHLTHCHTVKKYPDLRFQKDDVEPGIVIHGSPLFRPVDEKVIYLLKKNLIQHVAKRGHLFGCSAKALNHILIPLEQPEIH